MKKQDSNYNIESITSLKGAERVRLRPGVIFGSDGLDGCEHAFFEILCLDFRMAFTVSICFCDIIVKTYKKEQEQRNETIS